MPRPSLKFRAIALGARVMMSPVERTPIDKARRQLRASSTGPTFLVGAPPDLEEVRDERIAGVLTRRYRPRGARKGVIAFFHGGGWLLGDVASYDRLAGSLAAATAREVVSVEYRLAPEHRYPAALDDCVAVTRALAEAGRVAVAGDSAGGNLGASVANRIAVAAQLLMYPVTDCAEELPSHQRYATGHLLTREGMRHFRREYVPDATRRLEGGASPLREADLARSAPAYVLLAQCDVLRDEGVAYATRLREAGIEVAVDEVPGTLHGFLSLLGLREAREALLRASQWLDHKLV